MKLVLPLVVLCLATAPLLSAQEFQVDSTTSTGYSNAPGDGLSISERIDGSYNLPFDRKGGGFDLKAHVDVGYPSGFGGNLDVLSVTLVFAKPAADLESLKWVLGRFALSEPTGLILNHPGDGSQLVMNYGPVNLAVTTAYTGLVFRNSSTIALTRADEESASDLLASPRFIGSVDAKFKIFDNHQISLGALAQQDLTPRSKLVEEWSSTPSSTQGGTLDTQYLTVAGSGPIIDGLFYDTFLTFGTGSTLSWIEDSNGANGVFQYKPIVSFLGGLSVSYYWPEFYGSAFSGRLLVASGDGDATSTVEGNGKDASTLFVPVTSTSLGAVFNPGLSNLVFYELGASATPFAELPLVLGSKLLGFQRATSGVVNAPGVQRLGPVWLGEELDLTAAWKPYSDLTVSGALGFFLPSSGTYLAGSAGAGGQVALNVSANLSL